MDYSRISIIIGGILSVLMVLFHLRFPVLFGWKEDFEKIQPRNMRIFFTIHAALILFFLLFSVISFAFTSELAECRGAMLGIVLGYSLFWLWRTVWQIVYFRAAVGHRSVMTAVHFILIAVFGLLCAAYALPVLHRLSAG